MASLVQDKLNGLYRIDFKHDGKRKTFRTGTNDKKRATEFQLHLEALIAHDKTGRPVPDPTVAWVVNLPETMRKRLEAVGLLEVEHRPEKVVITLRPFLDGYLARRNDLKPASRLVVDQTVANLLTFFGADRDIASITPAECDDFARWLATSARHRGKGKDAEGLSPATRAKRLQWATAMFRDALRRKLIDGENPFVDVKVPKAINPERQVNVPAATIERIIEIVPELEWKLLLALSRYLGLRVPSEPFSLTWDCVDWERGRLRVPSPKTAVHGKSYRWVPILPEVRPHLDRLYEETPPKTVYIFSKLRERGSTQAAERGFWANVNLRKRLQDLVAKAGFQPWPKLWHNLRASAQTDLANRFPAHVVCEWLGNSEAVAKEHYLQVTDAHFEAAIQGADDPQHFPPHRAAEMGQNQANAAPGNARNPCKTGVSQSEGSGGRI